MLETKATIRNVVFVSVPSDLTFVMTQCLPQVEPQHQADKKSDLPDATEVKVFKALVADIEPLITGEQAFDTQKFTDH